MPSHERDGSLYLLRLFQSNRAQIKQIASFYSVAAVPHLLRNDLGTGFHAQRPTCVLHDVEGVCRQRLTHHHVDLSPRKEQLDVLGVLFVVGRDCFGSVAQPWGHVAEVLRIRDKEIDVFALAVRNAKQQDRSTAKGPYGILGLTLQVIHQREGVRKQCSPGARPGQVRRVLAHSHISRKLPSWRAIERMLDHSCALSTPRSAFSSSTTRDSKLTDASSSSVFR